MFSRSALVNSNRKFAAVTELQRGLKCAGGQLSGAKRHKIHQRVPARREERLSRLFPVFRRTVRAQFLRRFVRFTGFFPPPYVSTHCPPPSLQWVSFPPPSTPSVIGAASWPQCLWALPHSAHHTAAQAFLPCARRAGSNARAPAPELPARRNNAPLWPRRSICCEKRTDTNADAQLNVSVQ